MPKKSLYQRTLEFIRDKPGYDALEIAVKLGTKPQFLRLKKLEDEGLIRWSLTLNGWVPILEESKQ